MHIKFMFMIGLLYCIIDTRECLRFSSIEKAFRKGVDAYSGERWSECIVQLEDSLHLYKHYKAIVLNCRHTCNSQKYESQLKENINDLKIYEKYFIARHCLVKCLEKEIDNIHMDSALIDAVVDKMRARVPYEYLHFCYFHMNMLPKAVSAAYTFLVANPESKDMKNNLIYYTGQPEVDVNEIFDIERADYEVMYKLGADAYIQEKWDTTVTSMEAAISDYISWENTCRLECEQQPELERSHEFTITMSNYMASIVSCKQDCQNKLKTINYDSGVEYLAEILNYLQISYYRMKRMEDAAKALTSYLTLLPEDTGMIKNKHFYSTLIDDAAFIERPEITHYLLRDRYEKVLLDIYYNGNSNTILTNLIE